jgi:hypothetical protein
MCSRSLLRCFYVPQFDRAKDRPVFTEGSVKSPGETRRQVLEPCGLPSIGVNDSQ